MTSLQFLFPSTTPGRKDLFILEFKSPAHLEASAKHKKVLMGKCEERSRIRSNKSLGNGCGSIKANKEVSFDTSNVGHNCPQCGWRMGGSLGKNLSQEKLSYPSPSPRLRGPGGFSSMGKESQGRQDCHYPGQSRGCPANFPATLPLKEKPADLQALEISAGIISLENHDLPDRMQRKYDHIHFTERKWRQWATSDGAF